MGHLFLVSLSHSSAASHVCRGDSVTSEIDILTHRPIQTSVLGTIEAAYKLIAPVDENDVEFFILADNDTYIDLDIKFYVRSRERMWTSSTPRA